MATSAAPPAALRQDAPDRVEPLPPADGRSASRVRLRGDMAIVIGLTLFVWLCAWQFEVSERVFHWTRTKERYQLDEFPIVLLAFALTMLWFARRRFLEAQAALRLHDLAERRLADLLEANRRLARRTIDVQEAERRNLARELHDEMGQYLNAIKIDAITLQRRAAPASPHADALAGIVRNVNHVYWVINDMIRRLRPVGLDELGLAAALEDCVDGWRQRLGGTVFRLDVEGDLSGLDEQLNLTVYRLVQEGLTNVAKHAGATRVDLRVARGPESGGEWMSVSVRDDGRGAPSGPGTPARDSRPLAGGLGLIGMRERVQALQGELTLTEGLDGKGFGFLARIPVRPEGSA